MLKMKSLGRSAISYFSSMRNFSRTISRLAIRV
jgi:hypothetical protein